MKKDIRLLTKAADQLLLTTTNPRHRQILTNYRRHAMFEVSGRYQEILAPDMTVEDPEYWLYQGGAALHFKGMKKLEALYASLVKSNSTVMMLEDEQLWVNDTGFTSRSNFHIYMPGIFALQMGADVGQVEDLDAIYIHTSDRVMIWPYAEDGRMIGESIWVGGGSFRKCPADEVITMEECNDLLSPLLDRVPEPA